MTTVSLKGLDARYANIALELSHAESIVKAENPNSPALRHIRKVGVQSIDLAADAEGIYRQYEATDRRASQVLKGQLGSQAIRHYLVSVGLLRQAMQYVPEGDPIHLRDRIDTFMWLQDGTGDKVDAENLLLLLVAQERLRQDEKHGDQLESSDDEQFRILMEEVGEVVHSLNDGEYEDMEKELIEVAACAVKWLSVRIRKRRAYDLENGYTGTGNRPTNPAQMMGDMA